MKMFITIVWIGFYFLMFDILFKIGEKAYRNKFSKRVIASIFLVILLSTFQFLLEYGMPLKIGENIGTALTVINSFSSYFLGYTITPSPNLVVLVDVSGVIILVILFYFVYYFSFKMISKLKIGINYNKESEEITIKSSGREIRISGIKIRNSLFLSFLLLIEVRLGLFIFWIYPNQLYDSFFVLFILIAILIIFAFVLFFISMKEISQSLFIQSLFMDIDLYRKVLLLFEEYFEHGEAFLTVEKYDTQVKFSQDLGIIKTVENLTIKEIAELKRVPIEISDKHLKLYKQELERYLSK